MDPLPPDPYAALGVDKNATAAEIKSAWKKGVLRAHPDKAQDKEKANDDFHKIQSAWEILSDDVERQKYDDTIRLQNLRSEVYGSRGSGSGSGSGGGGGGGAGGMRTPGRAGPPPNVEIRTAKFSMPSSPGPGPGPGVFSAPGPARYAERGPSSSSSRQRSYDEEGLFDPDYFSASRTSSRKSSQAEPGTRKASSKSTKGKEEAARSKASKSSPTAAQKLRNERDKQRDKEANRERASKFAGAEAAESGSDGDTSPLTGSRRRYPQAPPPPPPSFADEHPSERKHRVAEEYIRSSKGGGSFDNQDNAPPPSSFQRTSSYRIDEDYEYHRNAKNNRPEVVRHSKDRSTRNPSPQPSRSPGKERSSKRERQRTESLDESANPPRSSERRNSERPKPTLRTSMTDRPQVYTSTPEPKLSRADTMPIPGSTSPTSRGPSRRDTTPINSTPLRQHTEARPSDRTSQDSGYNTSSPSEEPSEENQYARPTSKHTRYQYDKKADDSDVEKSTPRSSRDDYDYVLRKPTGLRRSPSPLDPKERERTPTASHSRSNSYKSSMAAAAASAGLGGGGSSRRPGASRENSTQSSGSPRGPPSLPTAQSMPIHPKRTGSSYSVNNVPNARIALDKDLTQSPTDAPSGDPWESPYHVNSPYYSNDYRSGSGSGDFPPSRRQSEDNGGRSSRRRDPVSEARDYDGNSPATRRASENLKSDSLKRSTQLEDMVNSAATAAAASSRSSRKDYDGKYPSGPSGSGSGSGSGSKKQRDPPRERETYPPYEKLDKSKYPPRVPRSATTQT